MSEKDGERELVLGNKQLLGIFFVATLLCGVFFAMGYVVGGNSAKPPATNPAADASTPTASDGQREQPKPPSITDTASPSPSTGDNTPGPLPGPEPQVSNNPTAGGAQPPAASPAPATAPAEPTSTISVSIPEKGAEYVQVSAPERPGADNLVRILRDAKLPAIMAESSKPKLYRVLVGPYHTAVALSEAKRKLKDLGYDGLVTFKQP